MNTTCYDHRDRPKAAPGCKTCFRITLECRIVRKTVDAFLKAGYALNVNNGGDDDELEKPTTHKPTILKALREADEDYLKVFAPTDYLDAWNYKGWVRFVYGNDGWDVISDYTTNLEAALKPVNDYVDTLQ